MQGGPAGSAPRARKYGRRGGAFFPKGLGYRTAPFLVRLGRQLSGVRWWRTLVLDSAAAVLAFAPMYLFVNPYAAGSFVYFGGPGPGGGARGIPEAARRLYGERGRPARAVRSPDRRRGEHGPEDAPRPPLGWHPAHRTRLQVVRGVGARRAPAAGRGAQPGRPLRRGRATGCRRRRGRGPRRRAAGRPWRGYPWRSRASSIRRSIRSS